MRMMQTSNNLWCGLQTDELRTNSRAADNIRLKEILKKGALTEIRTVVHLSNSGGYTNSCASNLPAGRQVPLFKNFFNPFFVNPTHAGLLTCLPAGRSLLFKTFHQSFALLPFFVIGNSWGQC